WKKVKWVKRLNELNRLNESHASTAGFNHFNSFNSFNSLPRFTCHFRFPFAPCFIVVMQINVGIITISDRASKGLYADLGGPALKQAAEGHAWTVLTESLVPDEKREIQRAIRKQAAHGCQLILTTGGT